MTTDGHSSFGHEWGGSCRNSADYVERSRIQMKEYRKHMPYKGSSHFISFLRLQKHVGGETWVSGLILIYVDTKENHMNLLFFFSKDWRDLGGLEPQKAS